MNILSHVPWHFDQPARGALPGLWHDPESLVIDLFEVTAGGYLLLTLGLIALLATGSIPADALAGRLTPTFSAGFLGTALMGFCGILYGLPRARGGGLWSVELAAAHYLAANAAIVGSIAVIVAELVTRDLFVAYLIVAVASVEVGGLIAMLFNLARSRWG